MKNKLIYTYRNIFHKKPDKLFSSPCRINLIGEHTDYNLGLALPAAISKYTSAVVGKRNDRKIYIRSLNKKDPYEVDLDNISKIPTYGWGNYPLGVFYTLKENGYKLPFGLNIIYGSNVPMASGLSSSASILNLTVYIASIMYGYNLDETTIANIAHESETKYNGLKCGILDEYAIALGKKDKCILLDCKSNKYSYESIDLKDYALVVIVSNVKRSLTVSPYNKRVEECQKALTILKGHYDIESLSDLKVSDLPNIKTLLNDEILFKRVRHIVTENQRVRDFIKASKEGDITTLANILNKSHESLKDDYEVSGEYLDYIHDISLKYGAIGERMTGAGFGGSSIALIKKIDFSYFKENLYKDYLEKYHIKAKIFPANICDGLKVKSL